MPAGGLVISLDFELEWGVRDTVAAGGGYRAQLLGAREAVPRMLERFAAAGVAATWATVGFLFAESRDEIEAFAPPPELRPRYADPRLDPYLASLGAGEADDPVHYAPSLIRAIAAAPRQRLGSHSFSHYYALEPGATLEAFEADVRAAVAIAAARGHALRSYVWPRHQLRRDHLPVLARHGFTVHRGPEPNALNRPRPGASGPLPLRAARLADSYLDLTGPSLHPMAALRRQDGVLDVPESRFLRPLSSRLAGLEPMRVRRVTGAMRAAAARGALFHLWWHPHNLGADLEANLRNLDAILAAFVELRERHGFASYSMEDVAEALAAGAGAAGAARAPA